MQASAPQPESRLSEWSPAAASAAVLPIEGRSRLHARSLYGFQTCSLLRGSEGMQSFQKEGVCACLSLTDASFLLEIVSSASELALVLNWLFVKPFVGKTRVSLDKRNTNKISSYIVICLCKSTLAFVPLGWIMALRNPVPEHSWSTSKET